MSSVTWGEAKWSDFEKKPIPTGMEILYSKSCDKYFSVDYLEDEVEDFFANECIDCPMPLQEEWPEWFEFVLCELHKPPHWDVLDAFWDYQFSCVYSDDKQLPDGASEVEEFVNNWIQKSDWGWESTWIAWDGTYQDASKEV